MNRLIQLVARYEEFERASAPAPQTLSARGAGTNLFFAGGRAKLLLDYLSRKSRMPAATTLGTLPSTITGTTTATAPCPSKSDLNNGETCGRRVAKGSDSGDMSWRRGQACPYGTAVDIMR